jgi:O-antigen/teichoic acid export membrane protein
MEGSSEGVKGNALLRYFGIETGDKARDVLLWSTPYLLFLTAGLVGLSFAVHFFFPLPLWIYVLAIGLPLVNLWFFLARIRQAGIEAQAPVSEDESSPEE